MYGLPTKCKKYCEIIKINILGKLQRTVILH
jgi:hypothetical protein